MSDLSKWVLGTQKEEINPTQKYPIIWKSTRCLEGECRDMRTSHRWSVPCGTPNGLMTECYDCHKTRFVEVEKN